MGLDMRKFVFRVSNQVGIKPAWQGRTYMYANKHVRTTWPCKYSGFSYSILLLEEKYN